MKKGIIESSSYEIKMRLNYYCKLKITDCEKINLIRDEDNHPVIVEKS